MGVSTVANEIVQTVLETQLRHLAWREDEHHRRALAWREPRLDGPLSVAAEASASVGDEQVSRERRDRPRLRQRVVRLIYRRVPKENHEPPATKRSLDGR